ncbi:MAG TPA: hypothetical protein VNU68_35375 [Verrucomicrobiae bacterium]|nr:hypothetical protein [Verrucomicrobiae bacterium]
MTDLSHRLRDTTKAVEDVLVASHGLMHDLAAHHEKAGTVMPPFWVVQGDLSPAENEKTSIAEALKVYGPGPLFHLWTVCRSIEALRVAWTGK